MFCLFHAHNRRADCIGHVIWGNMKAPRLLAGLQSPAVHRNKQLCAAATWHSSPLKSDVYKNSRLYVSPADMGQPSICNVEGNTLDLTSAENTLTPLFMQSLNNWLAFAKSEGQTHGLWQLLDSEVKDSVSQSSVKSLDSPSVWDHIPSSKATEGDWSISWCCKDKNVFQLGKIKLSSSFVWMIFLW